MNEFYSKLSSLMYTNMKRTDLPEPLQETLTNVSNEIGMSGDVFMETCATWLQYGQGRSMTYEQVMAYCR